MARTKEQKALIKQLKLTPKQAKFCELYATSEEYFANGTQAYIEAYKPKKVGNWYNTVRSKASQLLTKLNILEYIDHVLELEGLNDASVDKELNFLIKQKADLNVKKNAITEYNKLKGRIVERRALTDPQGKDILGDFLNEMKHRDEKDLKPKHNPTGGPEKAA